MSAEGEMNFEDAMSQAAKAADKAISAVMADYYSGLITDEDDITPALVGSLRSTFNGQIGGLTWSASIPRHRRGVAAEERQTGADILIHVSLSTPTQRYSKGVLIQAKRVDPDDSLDAASHARLQHQCNTMLAITPASFVFNYMKGWMRCGSATRIAGATSRNLISLCSWTSYRFFWELFRCSIGDPRVRSALVRDLPIPHVLKVVGSGQLDDSGPSIPAPPRHIEAR
jgi:hypothetical protein